MIRSSSYRTQCPRGRHSALEEKQEAPAEPFFVKAEKQGTANCTGQPFFQTKLNIGQPNDKYEQEADAVAGKVVNNSGAGTVVQQKEITGIQRLSTSKEEEKAATADARMVKDREIQEKPEIQRLATDKQEEKLGTNDQRMRRDKEIQTKPEIQRMCPGCEQEEKDGSVVQRKKGIKEEEGPVQQKTDGGTATTASASLSSRIESSSGKGNKLPAGTMAEMSNSFGVDFSHVNIHTNNEAVGMNRELGAQAFTHGSDIYFNSGKYNPETSTGKHLLAHELTHVVQQGNGIQKKIQRKMVHNGNILFEGDCEHLACNSKWACDDNSEDGILCPEGTRNAGKKKQPLFTCDKKCENADCEDGDDWMAVPKSKFGKQDHKCGDRLHICANGKNSPAYVRDKSEREAYEVSPAIINMLGLKQATFKGTIYTTGAELGADKNCGGSGKTGLNCVPAPLNYALASFGNFDEAPGYNSYNYAGSDLEGLKLNDGLYYGTWDKRPRVHKLQDKLTENGFYAKSDGMFGPKTLAALNMFQQVNGIPPTEYVDAVTANLLEGNSTPSTCPPGYIPDPGNIFV